MAKVSVEVPVRLTPLLRETVVLLYRTTLEALHLSLAAHAQAGGAGEEAARHRARLMQLDALLGGLDAAGDQRPAAVELSAPAAVLRDVLHGALIDAGERLAVACASGWRGEAGPDSVREAAREVIELDALLRRFERAG
jgi:hypothetical protein